MKKNFISRIEDLSLPVHIKFYDEASIIIIIEYFTGKIERIETKVVFQRPLILKLFNLNPFWLKFTINV